MKTAIRTSALILVGLLLAGWGTAEEARAQREQPRARAGQGEFYLINAHSGLCMDVNSKSSGFVVGHLECHGGDSQRWEFDPGALTDSSGVDWSQIRNVLSGKCLDIPGFSQSSRQWVQQYRCKNTGIGNQAFADQVIFFRADSTNLSAQHQQVLQGGHLVRLTAYHSGKCLAMPVQNTVSASEAVTTGVPQGTEYFFGQ